jgi:hypothetical protein
MGAVMDKDKIREEMVRVARTAKDDRSREAARRVNWILAGFLTADLLEDDE